MNSFLPRLFRSRVLHALACGVLGVSGALVLAQTKPPSEEEVAARKSKGGYHPERMKNPHLTGHPGTNTVTSPEDIPLNKLQVPPGFQVELWAHGHPGARQRSRLPKRVEPTASPPAICTNGTARPAAASASASST